MAQYLQSIGVARGDVVALLVSRSVEAMTAKLAILKCGAAYLVLDKANPLNRNRYCLEVTAAKVLIADNGDEGLLADGMNGISTIQSG